MSRSQLGLAVVLAVIILLGLPAFILPERSPVTQSDDSSGKNVTTSVPDTRLSLSKTTEAERREIRYRRKVNINTADTEELQTIPNIGPNMAEDILQYREDGNKFYRVAELDKIPGFGRNTVESIEDHVTVGRDVKKEAPSGGQTGGKLDINAATKDQLTALDGIGSVTADRIISYREENNGIESVEEFDAIPGIGSATIEEILPELEELSRKRSGIVSTKINVNTAGESELTELPGIGSVTAGRIIDYREGNGSFNSLEGLTSVSGIGDQTVEGLEDEATVN